MGTAIKETCGAAAIATVATTIRTAPRRTLISLPHVSVTRELPILETSSKRPSTMTTPIRAALEKPNSSSNQGPNVMPRHWLAPINKNDEANTK